MPRPRPDRSVTARAAAIVLPLALACTPASPAEAAQAAGRVAPPAFDPPGEDPGFGACHRGMPELLALLPVAVAPAAAPAPPLSPPARAEASAVPPLPQFSEALMLLIGACNLAALVLRRRGAVEPLFD